MHNFVEAGRGVCVKGTVQGCNLYYSHLYHIFEKQQKEQFSLFRASAKSDLLPLSKHSDKGVSQEVSVYFTIFFGRLRILLFMGREKSQARASCAPFPAGPGRTSEDESWGVIYAFLPFPIAHMKPQLRGVHPGHGAPACVQAAQGQGDIRPALPMPTVVLSTAAQVSANQKY